MQNVNHIARRSAVQNKAALVKAQAIAATAWQNRIDHAVQAFRGWELAADLLRLAYNNKLAS